MKQRRPVILKQKHQVSGTSKIPIPSEHDHVALFQKAFAMQQQGHLAEAEELCNKILLSQPGHFDALQLLAIITGQQNRLSDAVILFEHAIQIKPAHFASLNNCGKTLLMLKRYEEALLSYNRALAILPDNADAHRNRAFILVALKRYDEALSSYDRMIELDANHPETHYNRGNTLLELKRYEEAILSYDEALIIKPDYAEAYSNRGNALYELKRFEEAIASYNKAVTLRPDEIFLSNLGVTLQKNGLRLAETEACFRKALVLNPDYSTAHSNLLFFLTHDAKMTPEKLFQEHLAFGARFDAQIKENSAAHDNSKISDRRLNIGFVSGDFRNHPVAFLIEPLWQKFDCEKFKLVAYYNYDIEDHVTERLRGKVHLWRQVFAMSDLSLAKQIRADGIDILVDLSGHTGYNRLPVFALKPAPVQVSCIGYPATTGLKTIDYRLMDKHTAPIGLLDWQFSEKLVYLPSSNVFHTDKEYPELNTLPALTSKVFTFGSFNRLSKIGDCVLELWCRVLKAIPGSRLLLGDVPEKMQQERFAAFFEQQGITGDRLLFYPRVSMEDYLKLHHEIDLLLDSFPYSGGTTTNHGLSMGVPTITLAGQTLPSRHGVTILGRVGLECFVAESHEEYIEKAVYWRAHLEELNKIRSGIRDRINNSSMRSPDFVIMVLESALRQMWQRWCAGLPPESFEVHP